VAAFIANALGAAVVDHWASDAPQAPKNSISPSEGADQTDQAPSEGPIQLDQPL
jgi:hypothetical protein